MSGWFKGLVRNTFIHADDREGKDERKVKSWGAGDQAPAVEQKDVRLLDGVDHLSAINEECGVSDAAASVMGDHASNMGDPYSSLADPGYGMAEPVYGSDSHPLNDWKEKDQGLVPYVDSDISGSVVVDKMDLANSTDVTDEPAKVDPSAVDLPSPLQKLADAQAEMMMQQAALYQAQTRYFEEMTRRAEEQRQSGENRSNVAQPQYVGTEGLMPPMPPMPAPFMPVQTWPPMYVGAPMMPMQMELSPQQPLQQQQEQQQAFLDPPANEADKGKQQEEPWQRERDAPQALHCTTLMMRNLPNCYTREMVCGLLNDTGSRGRYDFLYLPLDGKRGEPTNKGYCFINFRVHEGAVGAWTALEGFDRWKDVASSKKITFHWAKEAQQGLDANVERYRNSPIMHDDVDKQFKPAMFDEEGNETIFPKPDKPFKKQRLPWPLRHHGGKGKDGGAAAAAP